MRGRSYSPPPRGYGRRGRSPSPKGRYGGRSSRADSPTSLLVRNLRQDCRADDLKRSFGQFGPIKDVYLPRDYHTGEPRGFGFIQYVDPADAVEAKYQMDGQVLQGRQLTVVFAEENRKKPTEMRARERGGRGRAYDRRRSPPRYGRLRSPPPRYGRSRSRSRDYYSPPPKGRYSRSISPHEKRYVRERSFSQSPLRGPSPSYNGLRSRSRTPVRERSPYGRRSLSQSPGVHHHSPASARSRSPYLVNYSGVHHHSPARARSRSPYLVNYSRESGKDGSPGL